MAFTEYLFDQETIRERAENTRANLLSNRGLSDAIGFAVETIWSRITRENLDYRTYGPYWWAVKDVLQRHSKEIGEDTQNLVKDTYSFDDDYETLVAAEMFRDWYRSNLFKGTNQFILDGESGETYTLFDSDMESPIAPIA